MNRLFPALAAISHRGYDHGSKHAGAQGALTTAFPVSTICHTVRLKQHSSCTAVEMATAPMMKHAHAVSITTRQWPRVEKMHKHKLIKYFCCFTMRARVLSRGGEQQGRDCMALLAIL